MNMILIYGVFAAFVASILVYPYYWLNKKPVNRVTLCIVFAIIWVPMWLPRLL